MYAIYHKQRMGHYRRSITCNIIKRILKRKRIIQIDTIGRLLYILQLVSTHSTVIGIFGKKLKVLWLWLQLRLWDQQKVVPSVVLYRQGEHNYLSFPSLYKALQIWQVQAKRDFLIPFIKEQLTVFENLTPITICFILPERLNTLFKKMKVTVIC